MNKKPAKTTKKKVCCVSDDQTFLRLPIVFSLFVSFIILVLAFLAVMDSQTRVKGISRAQQLETIRLNSIR